MRARRRRLWFGLLTVLGLSRRGFFIPYRYARSLPAAGRRGPYPAIEALLAGRSGRFREVLGCQIEGDRASSRFSRHSLHKRSSAGGIGRNAQKINAQKITTLGSIKFVKSTYAHQFTPSQQTFTL